MKKKKLTTKESKKAYRNVLKTVKGKHGLERAELIFDTLKDHELCTYSRWTFEQDMLSRPTDMAFAQAVMNAMIWNIEENVFSKEREGKHMKG